MWSFLDLVIQASHHEPVLAGLAIIGLEVLSFLLVLPSTFYFHVACGFLFGLPGLLLAPISNTLGATAGYLSSRTCAGCVTTARFSKKVQKLVKLKSTIERQPFVIIVSLKLSPLTPGGLTAFVLGQCCDIPLHVYVSAVFIGALPSVCAEVYVGTLLGELAELAGGKPVNPVTTAMFAICMVLSFAGCLLAGKRSKRFIEDSEGSNGEEQEGGGRAKGKRVASPSVVSDVEEGGKSEGEMELGGETDDEAGEGVKKDVLPLRT